MELPTTDCYGAPLLATTQAGTLAQTVIDTAVARILHKKFELGLFEQPYVDVDAVPSVYEMAEQRQLARHIAAQSMVLLKNDQQVLPLSKSLKTLAVIGPNADEGRHLLGDYSHPAHIQTLLDKDPGLATLLKCDPQSDGIVEGSVQVPTILDAIRDHVSAETRVLYAAGCAVNSPDRSGFDEAVRVAQAAEAVILVVGDKAGLTMDCTCGETRDRADLGLPGVQQELVEAIAATHTPIVLVLVNGRPLSIPWIAENIPAVLEAWLPGEEGGAAVADVLFGEVNPGGKIPMTFPRDAGQIPIFYGHKPSGGRSHWHGDYVSLPTTPLFPFGHGLSYTQFEYSDLKIDLPQVETGHVTISLSVKNIGTRAGDEVVQLYTREEVASVPRPVKELRGFKRIHLSAGEVRTIEFELPIDLLAFFDEALHLVVEPGPIQIMLGSSSEDIRLCGAFEITGDAPRRVTQRVFGSAVRVR